MAVRRMTRHRPTRSLIRSEPILVTKTPTVFSLCLLLGLPAVALALLGTSCQSRAQDCEETLTCGAASGSTGQGGASTGGRAETNPGGAGMGGMDAFGGFGGMGGMPLCSPLEGDCAEPALYVSPSGSDHADGSAEAPLATLGRALTLAAGRGLSIYACATLGPYVETLQLGPEHAGLRLLGGADCEDFSPTGARTHLVAQEASGHRIVGVSDVVLSRFTLTSPDAEEPGQSSIGLWISASDAVRLEQSVVSAGDGADGQAGESLPNPAESGADGNPGTDACVVPGDSLNLGGLAVTTTCQGVATVSSGGRGGSGGGGLNTPSGGAGEDGTPEDGGGLAGSGEAQSGGTACEDGGKGSPGGAGNAGAPAPQVGLLDASGYYPTLGHSGTDGTVGGGGGGGGGAKQAASPACPTGASGGSGGGGGCPGVGAGGGQSGGGSFGIVSYQSSLALQDVTVTVGLAGQGGAGGDGQAGGSGGKAGDAGLAGADASATDACAGGSGGKGGRGGSGGGGSGGPQVGIAYVGSMPTKSGLQVSGLAATGAAAGAGGLLNEDTGRGATGIVSALHEF